MLSHKPPCPCRCSRRIPIISHNQCNSRWWWNHNRWVLMEWWPRTLAKDSWQIMELLPTSKVRNQWWACSNNKWCLSKWTINIWAHPWCNNNRFLNNNTILTWVLRLDNSTQECRQFHHQQELMLQFNRYSSICNNPWASLRWVECSQECTDNSSRCSSLVECSKWTMATTRTWTENSRHLWPIKRDILIIQSQLKFNWL